MCGLVGCVAEEPVAGILLEGVGRVEYRGYDSAGMATISVGVLGVGKGVGRVKEIEGKVGLSGMEGKTGMAHTRWATHGGVTDANAHPHTSCRELVAVIHNGIIENYIPLKKGLVSRGHRFTSETDTEVIAHIIEDVYRRTRDPLRATLGATKKLRGESA